MTISPITLRQRPGCSKSCGETHPALETVQQPEYEEGSRRDSQAFATANLIVQIFTRAFFTSGPFFLFHLATPLDWTASLLLALVSGFLCEALLKRLLDEPDRE